MRLTKTKRIENTALLFILIVPFTITFYASYIFNPVHAGNTLLYLLQMLADIIAIATVSTLWITILLDLIQPEYHKRNHKFDSEWLKKSKPTVDVLIPVSHEPIEFIEKNAKACMELEYPHETWILDDGNSEEIKKLASKLKVKYIARPKEEKGFAKAGNINYGLKQCHGEFFAVFDADYVTEKSFLVELLPFFENKKVALVQTPQYYTNTDNFIASGTAQSQEIFYKYVQPAKNSYNASFCVGTSMIYRRSAINDVGGIAMVDHSEDIWTTILLHEKGWESIFYNKVLARGRAPETIGAYFRQQNRWAQGGFSLFFRHNPLFIRSLSVDQRVQYFFSNLHYFSGFAIMIYLVLPIIYLLFGLHPMDIKHGEGWLVHYIPYFLTVYFLPWFLLGSLKMSTIATSMASFFPYIKAFFAVAFKSDYTWVATESMKKSFRPVMVDIWPHIFLISISILSLVVGWYSPTDMTTTLVTSFWVLMNAYFLFEFIKKGMLPENAAQSIKNVPQINASTEKTKKQITAGTLAQLN